MIFRGNTTHHHLEFSGRGKESRQRGIDLVPCDAEKTEKTERGLLLAQRETQRDPLAYERDLPVASDLELRVCCKPTFRAPSVVTAVRARLGLFNRNILGCKGEPPSRRPSFSLRSCSARLYRLLFYSHLGWNHGLRRSGISR